jgi:ABC-type Fe3+ transport system permease subunit/streptogramin lyase
MFWGLLKNSLLVSGLATAGAVVLGFLAALWLAGLPPRWRKLGLLVSACALALPPFLVTDSWLRLLGQTGIWRSWLPLPIYSLGGAAWILALLSWPLTLFLVLGAWQRLEPAWLESDPALAGWPLIRTLLVPMAGPALAQAAVLTLVLTLNNFAVPAVLQVKVLPAELWVSFNTTFNYGATVSLCWPMVVAPLVLLAWLARRDLLWPRIDGLVSARLFRAQLGPVWFWVSGFFTLATLALAAALPLTQLAANPATWQQLVPALKAGKSACWNSFFYSAVTASLCLGLGVLGGRSPLRLLAWFPFLAPGVLLGILLIFLLNRPPLIAFYQSAGIVILAWTVRYVAFAWHGAARARQSVDPDLTDAARLEGASGWTLFRHVHWPQMAPSLAAAWYITYVLCLWDVETLVLIVPPGGETLAVRIFNLLHYGWNAQVNALCLGLLVLAALPLLLWQLASTLKPLFGTASHHSPPKSLPNALIHRTAAVSERPAAARPHLKPAGLLASLQDMRQNTACSYQSRKRLSLAPSDGERGGVRGPLSSGVVHPTARSITAAPRRLPNCCGWVLDPRCGPLLGCSAVALGFILAGCGAQSSLDSAPLPSKFFSRAQVIGSRGTGVGQFNKPRSLAVDRRDNFYVVDLTARVQCFDPNGNFLRAWQMESTDKGKPKGMGCDGAGNIIVVEPHYSRVNHFSTDGKLIARWGVNGTNTGQLAFPRGIAVNSRGELWVSEYGPAERIQHFTAEGKKWLSSIGEPGSGPGQFNRAEGLGIDAQGRLYVADSCNHRIQVFSPEGRFLRAYGKAGDGVGELSYPYDIRVDSSGYQYVCEFGNSRIQIFDAQDRSVEIIGKPGSAPGEFYNPWSIALDSAGNLYVADSGNHRVQKLLRNNLHASQPVRAHPQAQNGPNTQAALAERARPRAQQRPNAEGPSRISPRPDRPGLPRPNPAVLGFALFRGPVSQ